MLNEDQQQGRMLVIDEARAARELIAVVRMLIAEQGDHVIAETYCTGDAVSILNKARGQVHNSNFLIVSEHGDWSGFMPLRQALQNLDKMNKRYHYKYFAVVER